MVTFKRKLSTPAVPVPWELIDNYSRESTIHGMKYLGEKKQHWIERLFWVSILVVSISFCIKNMIELYEKRQEKPVMVSMSKGLTPTFDIPFPAVTICPEMSIKCDKINMTELINREDSEYTSTEVDRVVALSHICENNIYDENIRGIFNTSNDRYNVIESLEEMSLKEDEIFEECRYNSWKFESCDKYFYKILTDVGVCYTFNMLKFDEFIDTSSMHSDLHFPKHKNKSNWFLEKDYNSDEIHSYPRRVIGSGIQSGLSIKLKIDSTVLCPSCKARSNSFRVALHMPVEQSQISKTFYSIAFDRETNLIVKPNMIYASKDIKSYSPEKRDCYFSKERKLKYFKIYSKANCDLECKADYIASKCGCVKFSMPHSNETAVCNNTQLECVHEAELNHTVQDLKKKLMTRQLKRDIKHGKATKNDPRKKAIEKMTSCNCLPSCTSISYEVETSQTDYNVVMDGFHMARLNIYFKDAYFSRLKRYEMYGWADFLSNSGGTLGLFLGCSVLSFIEIIYHVILYLIRKIRKRKMNRTDCKNSSENVVQLERQ